MAGFLVSLNGFREAAGVQGGMGRRLDQWTRVTGSKQIGLVVLVVQASSQRAASPASSPAAQRPSSCRLQGRVGGPSFVPKARSPDFHHFHPALVHWLGHGDWIAPAQGYLAYSVRTYVPCLPGTY